MENKTNVEPEVTADRSMEKRAIGILVFVSFLWGSSFVGAKVCLNGGLLPFETVFYRSLIGTAVLGIVLHKHLRHFSRAAIHTGVTLGVMSAICYGVETYGVMWSDSANAAFLTSTNIVMMPFLYAVFFRETIRLKSVVSAVVSMVGVGFLSFTDGITGGFGIGEFLLLVTALFYGLSYIVLAKMAGDADSAQITFLQIGIVTVAMGVMTLAQGHSTHFGGDVIAATLFLALGPTLLGFLLRNYAVQWVDPVKCTLIQAMQGIWCAGLSVLLFDSHITWKILLGAGLIFAGIAVETLLGKQAE